MPRDLIGREAMTIVRQRIRPTIGGLVVIGLGVLCLWPLLKEGAPPPSGSSVYEGLVCIAPALLIMGVVGTFRALWSAAPTLSSGNLLVTGGLMLALGVRPALWLPWVLSDPDGEKTKALASLLFATMGIPGGLVLAVGIALVVMVGWS